MRVPFRALAAAVGGQLTPRPVIDVWLEGLDVAPLESLIDTGAVRTREGFLQHFRVLVCADEEWLECEPEG